MKSAAKTPLKKSGKPKTFSTAKLDELIEEATVDAYDESEQISGFFTVISDNLVIPFKTEVLGMEVDVEEVDLTDDEQIVVVCSRGKSRQRMPILDLPLPDPPPEGSEWIAAYRRWARRE